MADEKVNLVNPVGFLDLPLEDLFVPFIAKHLKIKDIFAFRCSSTFCKNLGDSALANVTEILIFNNLTRMAFSVILENCRRLQKISLCNFEWLTDEMMIELFINNPLLKFLSISCLKTLTPKALYPLATNCKKLTSLFLLDDNIFDATLLKLFNLHEIQLGLVEFGYSDGVSNEALAEFFEKQQRLQYIIISGYGISDRILEAIGRGCKDLRCLETDGYQFKSDDVGNWESLVISCPKLKHICLGLTEASKAEMDENNDLFEDFWHLQVFLHELDVSFRFYNGFYKEIGVLGD